MDLSYQQLAEIIREKINSNEYVFGLALPSERELAKSFDVSRSIVRSAIEQLCTEGILKKYHGKGTYIMLKDIDDSFKHFKGMSELLKKFGYDSSSKILNTRTRKAGYKFSMYQKIRRFFRCFDFVSEMNNLYLLKILIFYMTVSLILKILIFRFTLCMIFFEPII